MQQSADMLLRNGSTSLKQLKNNTYNYQFDYYVQDASNDNNVIAGARVDVDNSDSCDGGPR